MDRTDRQTDMTENITYPHMRVVIRKDYSYILSIPLKKYAFEDDISTHKGDIQLLSKSPHNSTDEVNLVLSVRRY